MSVDALAWAFRKSQSTGTDRLVLLVLADMAGEHQGVAGGRLCCWPSLPLVAQRAAVSLNTARRCVQSLAALGEIEVLEQGAPVGGPGGRSHLYVLPLSACAPPPSLGGGPPPTHGSPPLPVVGGEAKENPKGSTSPLGLPLEDARWEALWRTFPRRTDKQRAVKAYRARIREGVAHERIALAVERYAADCRAASREEQFIKHPATLMGSAALIDEWADSKPAHDPDHNPWR